VKKLGTYLAVCTLVLGLAGLAAAQGMPPLPKPGPEHALFKEAAGVWDAKVESWMAPGAPPSVSKGVETNRVGCGGLCLITDFKGSFVMGPPGTPAMAFEGHGTETYDQGKKKYVGTWIDSMSTGLSLSESTYDAATKTMTGTMEGPDMTGAVQKMKSVMEHKDGQRIFTMSMTGPDGKETPAMKITYTKRKGAAAPAKK
jgi:uncharacterized protein DUF1579